MNPRLFVLVASAQACSNAPATPADAAADVPTEVAPEDVPAMAPPTPPVSEPGLHNVTVADTRRVVPSEGLPRETPAENSNNNLDVVRHDGRVYLAWRTSHDHYASPDTKIHVVSSTDEMQWRFEASFSIGRDLREPRFLSYNGALFLYVARLGTTATTFEPQGMSRTERRADGTWTPLEPFYRPGFIGWRTRVERGRPYMLAYRGGENIYLLNGMPLEVELLTTTDGREWAPLDPARPVIYRGGGSETDFALADDGSLYGVIRNEAGDATGWGSKVCRAPAGDLANWTCQTDARKFDSPLMFWHDGEAYLVARRNVTETGVYDLMRRDLPAGQQTGLYLFRYSFAPKRCALWRYDRARDRVVFILDLPSQGDTCFPAMIQGADANEVVIYNYSSPIDGNDPIWSQGQAGPTHVYRHVLRFTRR